MDARFAAEIPHAFRNWHDLSNRRFSRERKYIARYALLGCLGLSACGGGGGDDGTATAATSAAPPTVVTPPTVSPPVTVTPPPAPVQPAVVVPPPAPTTLASYAGTWYGPCLGRMQDTAVLSAAGGGADALRLNLVRNFHGADGCVGAVVASETLSADFSLTYRSTTTAAAILAPGAAARPVSLDLVTIAIPAYTRSRSGSAVTSTTSNGVLTWCIAYSDGTVCSNDAGPQPAASAPGALTLDNGELVLLSPSGASYIADARYTRERATSTQSQGPAFQRIDIVLGSGVLASSGRTVTVNYTGWLYDASKANFKGAQFDTSIGKVPFTFRLGAGQVIAGWEQGVPGMRAGGKRTLIIPASMAYGRTGSGTSIPPDAPLIFDVDLISVQ